MHSITDLGIGLRAYSHPSMLLPINSVCPLVRIYASRDFLQTEASRPRDGTKQSGTRSLGLPPSGAKPKCFNGRHSMLCNVVGIPTLPKVRNKVRYLLTRPLDVSLQESGSHGSRFGLNCFLAWPRRLLCLRDNMSHEGSRGNMRDDQLECVEMACHFTRKFPIASKRAQRLIRATRRLECCLVLVRVTGPKVIFRLGMNDLTPV